MPSHLAQSQHHIQHQPVILLLVVHVAVRHDVLDDAPVEVALRHVLPPVLAQGVGCFPQVVPGDFGAHMVGYMPADVVGQELHPAHVQTMVRSC